MPQMQLSASQVLFKISPQRTVNLKVIHTGNFIEIYHYSRGIVLNRIPKRKKTSQLPLIEQISLKTQNYLNTLNRKKRRAMDKIVRTIQTNFDKDSLFLTLTFNDFNKFDITNILVCNKKLHNFITRLRRLYPDFKYLCVPEFQNRLAVHYHLIINKPFISKYIIQKNWPFGFIKVKDIYNEKGMGFYFTKYLQKNADTPLMWGVRSFSCSRNIKKPRIYYDKKAKVVANYIEGLSYLQPIQVFKYSGEFCGDVVCSKYFYPLSKDIF